VARNTRLWQTQVRDLDLLDHTAKIDRLVAPVELVGLATSKKNM